MDEKGVRRVAGADRALLAIEGVDVLPQRVLRASGERCGLLAQEGLGRPVVVCNERNMILTLPVRTSRRITSGNVLLVLR